jgi:anaerobic selenocysteine-containing dehydrogenase
MCPIVVTIEDGRAIEVHGDREAPLFEGYTCPKGRALPEIHANPNRLLHSLRRRADRTHEPIASAEAIDEIAVRLRDIVDRYGPNAVAIYIGTSSAAYPAMGSIAAALITALGSKMIFSAASIDQPGTRIADAMHGLWLGGRTPFDDVDAFLFAGTNPVISKQFLAENPAKRLARAVERGTKVIVIDPRRTETARRAHVHLQPRPGQDPFVVAGLLHVILREGLVDEEFISAHVDGVESLRAATAPFTPEFVAHQADIPIDDLVEAARTLGNARRGGAGGGTGISMTSCTSVTSYLMLCLMSLRGWWAREGDRIERPNVLMPPNRATAQARRPYRAIGFGHKMRVRGLEQTNGGLPTAALADEILLPGEGQIRALLNVGGSPMMAWPDQRKTREALESLELFVTTDVEYSPTARMADYVIATKMTFETPSMTQVTEVIKYFHPGYGFRAPYAQYTPALLEPPPNSDLIEDWQLYFRVAQRLGLSLNIVNVFGRMGAHLEAPIQVVPLDMEHEPSTDDLYEIMCRGSHVSLDEVKRHPHGHVFEELLDQRVGPSDPDCEDRLDVGNADILRELGEIFGLAHIAVDTERPFLFVPRRENRVINTTGRTLPGLMRGRHYNPAFMHPDDLARLDIAPGALVEIRSEYDAITGVAEADADLRTGVVSMSHNFGGIPGDDEDPRIDGANTNRLVRTDVEYDRYTGIPRMGALPVAVVPCGVNQS